jgi:23S rRNA G2445 N2-methylase RlmL
LERLRDEDTRTRRMAAVALGKLADTADEEIEAALARAAQEERAPAVRRALVAALGRAGGRAALEVLSGLSLDGDVAAVRPRAELMVQRTLAREQPSSIAADAAPERPVHVAARCRRGLEPILAEELAAISDGAPAIRRDAPGGARVELRLSRPLTALYQARTLLSFALPLPPRRIRPGEDLADAVAERLLSRQAGAILRRFTTGPIRFRIDWVAGGKRRALTWKVAQAVQARAPDLINDPRESVWEVAVYEERDVVRVELAPDLPDPRFAYRRGDVPAASHPTIAAALARIAGARPDDVVWDPFVGSGLELCERALLGPFRRLVGSDRDAAALAVARENLAAAGAEAAEILERDARAAPPMQPPPTLILTNPPLGRRVHRQGDLPELLERFVERAARALAPGGRLVWISPFPGRTEAAARRSGLRPTLLAPIDMGGFEAQIQAFSKDEAARAGEGRGRSDAGGRAQRAGARREQGHGRSDGDRDDQQDDHAAPGRAGRRLRNLEDRSGRGERGRRDRA